MYTRDSRRFFSVCFVLILFLPVLLMSVPSSVAHDPPMSIPTWAYLSVTPNPVGVGQEVFVNFFLDKAPPTANAQYGDRWHNFKVTVTKPDGSTEDLELGARSDSDAWVDLGINMCLNKLGSILN